MRDGFSDGDGSRVEAPVTKSNDSQHPQGEHREHCGMYTFLSTHTNKCNLNNFKRKTTIVLYGLVWKDSQMQCSVGKKFKHQKNKMGHGNECKVAKCKVATGHPHARKYTGKSQGQLSHMLPLGTCHYLHLNANQSKLNKT